MKFGPVPLSDADGAVLAHSLGLTHGRMRKGTRLDPAALAQLAEAGHEEVIVARLEPGDIDENRAAARLARALVPDPEASGLTLTEASTGRVNIYADGPGVLRLDADAIDRANLIDPMITIATLPPFALTRARGMVATVKIIAYAVPETALKAAEKAAADALTRAPVVLRTAHLIMTDIGAGPGKGEAAIAARLAALGIELVEVTGVPHRAAEIAAALSRSTAELQLILTASATSDPHDVAPEAVRAAGGVVERFGMPVDPGNLLFIGQAGGRPVIGLPGCARSPALNGADWVLERVACGLAVTDRDIAEMGVGGLLKESPARPHPRETG